jgi:hypothetical protein
VDAFKPGDTVITRRETSSALGTRVVAGEVFEVVEVGSPDLLWRSEVIVRSSAFHRPLQLRTYVLARHGDC